MKQARQLQCPHCGTTVTHGFTVCRGCGAEVQYGLGLLKGFLVILGALMLTSLPVLYLASNYIPEALGHSTASGLLGLAVLALWFVGTPALIIAHSIHRSRNPLFVRRYKHRR